MAERRPFTVQGGIGGGTGSPGIVKVGLAGTDVFRVALPTGAETTGELVVLSGNNLALGTSTALVSSGTNVLGLATGTAPTSCAASGCIFASSAGTTIMNHDNSTTQIGESGIVFGAANGTTQLVQTAGTTGTGSAMIVAAQSMSGAGATGGGIGIQSGSATGTTGSTTGGILQLFAGSATATSGSGTGGSVNIQAGAGVNAGAPGNVTIYAGAGGSSAGGNISLSAPGTAANNGYVRFLPNGFETLRLNNGESDFLNGTNIAVGTTNAAVANGTNVIGLVTGTAPSSCSQNACIFSTASGFTVLDGSGLTVSMGGTAETWNNGSTGVNVGTAGTGTFTFTTGPGVGGASSSPASGTYAITTGSAAVATSGTAVGGHGGDLFPTTGSGAAGLGGTSNGGRGGNFTVNTGNGGAPVSTGTGGKGGNVAFNAGNGGAAATGTNGAGGDIFIDTGAAGAGAGTAALNGAFHLQINGTDILDLKPSLTNSAAAELGLANGYNFTIGSTGAIQATGTNILGFVSATQPTSCGGQFCMYATSGQQNLLFNGNSTATETVTATTHLFNNMISLGGITQPTIACGGTVSLTAAQSVGTILSIAGCSSGSGATTIKSTVTPAQAVGVLWMVSNRTIAATLSVEFSSGTAVAIPTNTSAIVTSNGTNAIIVMSGT